jgi:hypothetical protein
MPYRIDLPDLAQQFVARLASGGQLQESQRRIGARDEDSQPTRKVRGRLTAGRPKKGPEGSTRARVQPGTIFLGHHGDGAA